MVFQTDFSIDFQQQRVWPRRERKTDFAHLNSTHFFCPSRFLILLPQRRRRRKTSSKEDQLNSRSIFSGNRKNGHFQLNRYKRWLSAALTLNVLRSFPPKRDKEKEIYFHIHTLSRMDKYRQKSFLCLSFFFLSQLT